MTLLSTVGTVAAICTTGAFVPQIIKIRKQGGEDLSYAMLAVYFAGVALWLVYGLMIAAAAVIWANASSLLLVAIAIFLKARHASRKRAEDRNDPSARAGAEPEIAAD
ncbi:MAG: SemiSWEET family sugar transporter [Candidatus Acidiferrales bacterium]